MADKEAVRRDAVPYIVSLYPDVCYTPVGGPLSVLPELPAPLSLPSLTTSMQPVPYHIYGEFTDVQRTQLTVRMDGKESVTAHSFVPTVTGDELGIGGGVLSKVNRGCCRALTYSKTVRAGGQYVVRDTSVYAMNSYGPDGEHNTVGRVMYFVDGMKPPAGIDWDTYLAMLTAQQDDFLGNVGRMLKGIALNAVDAVVLIGRVGISLPEKLITGRNIFDDIEDVERAILADPEAALDAYIQHFTDAANAGDWGTIAGELIDVPFSKLLKPFTKASSPPLKTNNSITNTNTVSPEHKTRPDEEAKAESGTFDGVTITDATNIQKGIFGEFATDYFMELNGATKVDFPQKYHGIDAIYRNPNGPPDYFVVDSKFGSSSLSDRQLSIDWVSQHLNESGLADEIDGNYIPLVAKVDKYGDVELYKVTQDPINKNKLLKGKDPFTIGEN